MNLDDDITIASIEDAKNMMITNLNKYGYANGAEYGSVMRHNRQLCEMETIVKKYMALAELNVTETSCVAVLSQPSDAVVTVCKAADVVNAPALTPVQPPATAAASALRSVSRADLICMTSPVAAAVVLVSAVMLV